MKKTLSTYAAADIIARDEYSDFTFSGALAIIRHLEEIEDSTGEEMELDVVAIRCDWMESQSLILWAKDYFSPEELIERFPAVNSDEYFHEEETREQIRAFIHDRGTLIEFDSGVIVSQF